VTTGRNPHERQAGLLERLAASGFMSVGELAAATGVSEITVRRDLVRLERSGVIRRTHGGALPVNETVFDPEEPSFGARRRRNAEAKAAIAKAAARLVRPGQSIAIDTGSTALELARQLAGRERLTIVTNSTRVAGVLADQPNPVYLPAGRVRGEELSICGSSAVEAIQSFQFDLFFLGISGLTPEGAYDYSPEDAEVKRALIERTSRVVVLCDQSKFNRRALVRVAHLAQLDVLVCDRTPKGALATALGVAGVTVEQALPGLTSGEQARC
jgi:DeoR family glycerol-3-phosphate regulon repressor